MSGVTGSAPFEEVLAADGKHTITIFEGIDDVGYHALFLRFRGENGKQSCEIQIEPQLVQSLGAFFTGWTAKAHNANQQIDALIDHLEAIRREPVVAHKTITNEGETS